MTPEERVTKLEELMIVQGQLVVHIETRVDKFGAHVEAWVNATENHIAESKVRMAQLAERHNAVIERLDRFIAGLEGKG